MGSNNQQELWEELSVESNWFHVVRSMVQRDKIAEMGLTAWAVYCVLKSYAELSTGDTFPGRDKIARHIGASEPTVDRALAKLVKMGIVEKRKMGRNNGYELTETIPLLDEKRGRVVGEGSTKYIPLQFQQVMDQLKAFAESGNMPKGGVEIKIVLNANFVTGDNPTINNNVYQGPAIVSAEISGKGDAGGEDI